MNVWIEAARPKTLGAAIVPVAVGTATAATFSAPRFAGTLAVALGLQIGVNFANDYYDGVTGIDAERTGPRRMTALGLVAAARMRAAAILAFAIAAAAGVALCFTVGWILLVPGAASIAAALSYSGGKNPYGSKGFGEVFVFLFFGLVATVGAAYVQDPKVTTIAIVCGVSIGLLAAGILMANNLRDINTDEEAGKFTLAVRVGPTRARRLYRLSVTLAFAALFVVAAVGGGWIGLLPLFSAPAAVAALNDVSDEDPALLTSAVRLHLIFGFQLATALLIG